MVISLIKFALNCANYILQMYYFSKIPPNILKKLAQ